MPETASIFVSLILSAKALANLIAKFA